MFSFVGDTVVDPFGGTGTTAMAALIAGRNSITMEIEPRYVESMEERLRKADVAGKVTIHRQAFIADNAPQSATS